MIEINNIELCIQYQIATGEKTYDLIEIKSDTFPEAGLLFSILDKDPDHASGATTIQFNSIEELKEIINDFSKRMKKFSKEIKE